MTTDNETITPILFGFERECKRSPDMVCCRFACQDANECQWNSQPTSPRQEGVASPFVAPSLAAHDGDKSAATDTRTVPAEPTEEMIVAGYNALMEWDARTGEDNGIADIYNAMIAVALSRNGDSRFASEVGIPATVETEEMLVIEQQDRNLHDIVDMATDLLASLDPGALNPEQFIAWCALAYRVGYAEAGLSP